MADSRITITTPGITSETESRLREMEVRGVKEAIYILCVGYQTTPTAEEFAFSMDRIKHYGMTPSIYTEDNNLYDLTVMSVESNENLEYLASIAKKTNQAVLFKHNDNVFIYGVTANKKWEITQLDANDFSTLNFPAEPTLYTPNPSEPLASRLTREMYAAIAAVKGHRALYKWLLENETTLNKIRAVGGTVGEVSDWHKDADWIDFRKQVEDQLTKAGKGMMKRITSDCDTFINKHGRDHGVTTAEAKDHILDSCADVFYWMRPTDPNTKPAAPRALLFAHITSLMDKSLYPGARFYMRQGKPLNKESLHLVHMMHNRLKPAQAASQSVIDSPVSSGSAQATSASAAPVLSPKLSPKLSPTRHDRDKANGVVSAKEVRDTVASELIAENNFDALASVADFGTAVEVAKKLAKNKDKVNFERFLDALDDSAKAAPSSSGTNSLSSGSSSGDDKIPPGAQKISPRSSSRSTRSIRSTSGSSTRNSSASAGTSPDEPIVHPKSPTGRLPQASESISAGITALPPVAMTPPVNRVVGFEAPQTALATGDKVVVQLINPLPARASATGIFGVAARSGSPSPSNVDVQVQERTPTPIRQES